MSMHSIIYASQSLIPPAYAIAEIDELVAKARVKNASLGITGALVYSERRFAQALEGDRSNLAPLMDLIRSDPRHEKIVILEDAQLGGRRFEGWSLAYSGASTYVDQIIARASYEAGRASDRGLLDLKLLMREFAALALH